MPEYLFSLIRIFPYKDRIVDYTRKKRLKENPCSGIFYTVHQINSRQVFSSIQFETTAGPQSRAISEPYLIQRRIQDYLQRRTAGNKVKHSNSLPFVENILSEPQNPSLRR